MQDKGKQEMDQKQGGVPEGKGEPAVKRGSKVGRVARKVVTWVLMLAFLVFFIMLFVKKCTGQI